MDSISRMIPDSANVSVRGQILSRDGDGEHVLFSLTPTMRFLTFQPGPLTAGRGLRISIDWLPCTCGTPSVDVEEDEGNTCDYMSRCGLEEHS